MALSGVRVLEIAGLAPAPFCGMVLADFGASVVRVNRVGTPKFQRFMFGVAPGLKFDENKPALDIDILSNGKKSIAINLKSPKGVEVFKKLCSEYDVIIEPFRKGVMERMGLGPSELLQLNPRLIYARLTGFGQKGSYSGKAGHDINFMAMSGVLSELKTEVGRPMPPVNASSDFGGGGLMCALGIVMALLERHQSQRGQVVDCDIVGGTAYLASWLMRSQTLPVWGQPTGHNLIDGGAHFYGTYETKDGGWMAVGALEPQFYEQLLQGLGLSSDEVPHFPDDTSEGIRIFAEKFREKTRDEWCQIFEELDACVVPVLTIEEAPLHPHNIANNSFAPGQALSTPHPKPSLSRTPGLSQIHLPKPQLGQHTREVLREAGYSPNEVEELIRQGDISCNNDSKL